MVMVFGKFLGSTCSIIVFVYGRIAVCMCVYVCIYGVCTVQTADTGINMICHVRLFTLIEIDE